MDSNFRLYRDAARDVGRGWLRGDFKNLKGDKCLVQGVLDAAGIPGTHLPPAMVDELDARLQHYWYYRMLRAIALTTGRSVQDAIMLWNDTTWKRRVVDALNLVADDLELQWLRDEHVRLTAEVNRLTTEVTSLKQRVKELESETSRLRRLTNSFALRSDRKELESLEAELTTQWDQLNSLPKLPA
jgi:chromosome segregation ATPase